MASSDAGKSLSSGWTAEAEGDVQATDKKRAGIKRLKRLIRSAIRSKNEVREKERRVTSRACGRKFGYDTCSVLVLQVFAMRDTRHLKFVLYH